MPRLDQLLADEDADIAEAALQRLHLQGVRTVEALFALEDSLSLESAQWDFLLDVIESRCAAPARSLLFCAPADSRIRLGVRALDSVLSDDGLVRGAITELVGRPATGKTQLCLFAALMTAAAGGSVVYVDASRSFRARRLHDMAAGHGVDWPSVGARLRVFDALDIPQLVGVLDRVAVGVSDCSANNTDEDDEAQFWRDVRLLVVDSLGPLLSTAVRTGPCGDASFDRVATQLAAIAATANVAVLTVNYARSAADAAVVDQPGLGSIWKYTPNIQIQVSADVAPSAALIEDKLHRLTVIKSDRQPLGVTTYFCLDSRLGVRDHLKND